MALAPNGCLVNSAKDNSEQMGRQNPLGTEQCTYIITECRHHHLVPISPITEVGLGVKWLLGCITMFPYLLTPIHTNRVSHLGGSKPRHAPANVSTVFLGYLLLSFAN